MAICSSPVEVNLSSSIAPVLSSLIVNHHRMQILCKCVCDIINAGGHFLWVGGDGWRYILDG